jgi:hypothetical protein
LDDVGVVSAPPHPASSSAAKATLISLPFIGAGILVS